MKAGFYMKINDFHENYWFLLKNQLFWGLASLAFPLQSMKDQDKVSGLCLNQLFLRISGENRQFSRKTTC